MQNGVRPAPARHLVWDWNGTLFNDAAAIYAATNDIFAAEGVWLSEEQYRAAFTRPLASFYATALNKPIDAAEFHRLDEAFHAAYRIRMRACSLAPDALSAISSWRAAGHTQSLLSMWVHEELVRLVTELRLTNHFVAVNGRTGGNAGGKSQPLARHLAQLGVQAANVTLIGDSIDDATAADSVGAQCVLIDAGTHERQALLATGHRVVATLTEAIELALEPQ